MFGAGVINTLYGYALAQTGNEVTHYVRPGKKKMLEGGISLKFLDGRANPPRQESAHYDAKIVESLPNDDGTVVLYRKNTLRVFEGYFHD